MSKKYSGKNALVAAIMANAYASSLKKAEPEPTKATGAATSHAVTPIPRNAHNKPHLNGVEKYNRKRKATKHKSGSTSVDFDINAILKNHHDKHQKTKPKHKRKSSRSYTPRSNIQINTNKPKRQSNNVRISRSLSPRLFKSNSKKAVNKTKTKTKGKAKTRAKKSKSQSSSHSNSDYHLSAPSLQSIHSDDEADEFDDILSPKHASFETTQRKEKLRSVLEDIFGDSCSDDDALILEQGEPDIDGEMEAQTTLKYETKSFTLSIAEDIESFSMNLGYILEISPFTEVHIGFDEKKRARITHTGNNEKAYDVNTYWIESVSASQIYEQYVLEFGEPKTPKYLMSFAKQKGKRMSLSEAIGFMSDNTKRNANKRSIHRLNEALSDLMDAEKDAHRSRQMPIAHAINMNGGGSLSGLLDSDYSDDARPPQSHVNMDANHMVLPLSSTLLSATPEPQSSSSDMEHVQMHPNMNQNGYKKQQQQQRKKHKRGSNCDLLVNINDVDTIRNGIIHKNGYFKQSERGPGSHQQQNNGYLNIKKKRKKKKKHRSHSQPSKAIQDLMNEMDSSFDNLKHVPIIARSSDPLNDFDIDAFDTFDDTYAATLIPHQLPSKSPQIGKKSASGPSTPRMSNKKRKSKGAGLNHQRSLSTDQPQDRNKTALKLDELALNKIGQKNSKRRSISRSKSKTILSKQKQKPNSKLKKHKMDFNLYDISIRPNRRYRLIDGRIGMVKFKGKTVFAKGCETYIGILLEFGDGVHNGTVAGKSYFRCKDGKGDMVRPYQIIEDLGRFTNPITQQLIDDGDALIKDANIKLKQYIKQNNIKLPRKHQPK